MKKVLVVAAILVGVAIWMVNAKTNEASRNKELGQACFAEACKERGVCAEAVDTLYPAFCFNGAYRFSLAPGGDTVNLDALLTCMNKTIVAGGFEVSTASGAAPLTFPTSEPQPPNAGLVFAFDSGKVDKIREKVRTGAY